METEATKGTNLSEALGVWLAAQDDIDRWIASTLRTMGLPEHASGRGIRRALLADFFLCEDIRSEVAEAYWLAVRTGRIAERDGLSWAECARRWLYRVTKRTSQRLATAQARVLLQLADDIELGDPSRDRASRPDQYAERRETMAQLRRALQRLPAADARLLVLRVGWEVPFTELACQFGTTVGALRTRVCRTREKVRWMMLEHGARMRLVA